jgi:hypothetical protein
MVSVNWGWVARGSASFDSVACIQSVGIQVLGIQSIGI